MESAGRAQVFIRVRPLSTKEAGLAACVETDDAKGLVRVRNDSEAAERLLMGQASEAAANVDAKEFSFDSVFPQDSTQRDIFSRVGLPVLRECLKGFNGTILAYGQTGSGKTHSLLHQGARGEDAGLLPRLVASLFVQVAQDSASVYQIEAAAVQVYNEQVDDLLHPEHQTGGGQNINVQGGGAMAGLTWVTCRQPQMLLDAFTKARAGVVYAETKMNKASSRSHAVFQIRIVKRQRATCADKDGPARRMECTHSLLSVVDLAGSERVKRSGVEGVHFKEATAINKSLLAFGNVVSALASKRPHVPFRDSKLTKILECSIGGNCKTALLVCASPSQESAFETLNSLEFASRAMRVEVNARVNSSVVEVAASDLLADLSSNLDDLGVSLGSELDAMRRASAEVEKKAANAVKQRQEAVDIAEAKAQRLQQDVIEIEKRSQAELAAQSKLLQNKSDALDKARRDAEHIRECAKQAEGKIRKDHALELDKIRFAQTEELQKLRQAQIDMAQEVAADKQAMKKAHAAELEAAKKSKAADLDVAKKAHMAEVSTLISKHAAELQAAKQEAEARVIEAQDLKGREERAQALAAARREHEAELVEIANARATERAEFESALSRLREELQRADANTKSLQESLNDVGDRLHLAEIEVAARTEELKSRTIALDEARASLAALAASSTEAEASLKTAHANEVLAIHEAHKAELSQLVEQHASQSAEFASRLASAEEEVRKTLSEQARQLADAKSRWANERSELEQSHAEELDVVRENVAAQLSAGRKDFEDRLAAREQKFEEDLNELRRQLAARENDLQLAEVSWQKDRDEAVSHAWEVGNAQQRKLAAAFKAARSMVTTREAQLREEHDALMETVALHKVAEDDLRRVADEQDKDLQANRQRLQSREREIKHLANELKHREDTDRIFGGVGLRGAGGSGGLMPPLPGKRCGESQSFSDRRRRQIELVRSASTERPPRPSSEGPTGRTRGSSLGPSGRDNLDTRTSAAAWMARSTIKAC
eukprot:TRINITY_DN20945_c0_g1_i1.p1 TRINITY_DN20945_c0_g1~~TRINITY_DN20945_c0_g1_i1.p1  ORF type:complete len:1025 (-),score=188.90 TRINITY_DN20945_c0_g1_i1:232-3258(-)